MKKSNKPNICEGKSEEITPQDYWKSLPKRVVTSPRKELQDRIAKKCDVSPATVYNWFTYGFKPRRKKWIEICRKETGMPLTWDV